MYQFEDKVLDIFIRDQLQLFPEEVATNREEANDFLVDCYAKLANSPKEVWDYFNEEVIDMEGADALSILEADEVFDLGDGRYLIVEG